MVCADPCGDGAPDPGEECDDGNGDDTDGCTTHCTLCGNASTSPPETCDDGNALGCDGCSHLCQLEPTPTCPSDGNVRTQDCSPTQGCTYAPRCALATDICTQQAPEFRSVGDRHAVACWNSERAWKGLLSR